ncbi:hypothetical protein B0H14DRAFT_3169392 [Mycena olivaceomarginata]|nr:hypothetical protein B0H14DRAFT_3169392 [Mycena olivaceomarginata]
MDAGGVQLGCGGIWATVGGASRRGNSWKYRHRLHWAGKRQGVVVVEGGRHRGRTGGEQQSEWTVSECGHHQSSPNADAAAGFDPGPLPDQSLFLAIMDDWTTFAIAEPGYESDTGPRDIPTLSNFETATPVTVVHGNPARGGNRKVLNRRGRAICRVMAARGWSCKAIAYIFRISESSVSRAVENQFYKPPRDRIEDDLERAGTEFRGELPSPPPEARLKDLLTTPVLRKVPVLIDHLSDESDLECVAALRGMPVLAAVPRLGLVIKWTTGGNSVLLLTVPFVQRIPAQRAAKKRCHNRLQEVAADENEDEAGIILHCCNCLCPMPQLPDQGRPMRRTSDRNFHNPRNVAQWKGHQIQRFRPREVCITPCIELLNDVVKTAEQWSLVTVTTALTSLDFKPVSRPHFSPLPLPQRRPSTQSQAPTSQTNSTLSLSLSDFLLQALPSVSTDLASLLELLTVQGFTPPHLCALAMWNAHEVHEALNDLLMERPRALGYAGMTALIFVKFEIAIRKLVGIAPTRAIHPSRDPTPACPHFPSSWQTLRRRRPARYAIVAPAEVRATLRKTLLDPTMTEDEETTLVPTGMKGMSPLELWAVELCVRRAAEERKSNLRRGDKNRAVWK